MNRVLRDDQPPSVVFTVVAQWSDIQANETEMGATLFTKMAREGSLTCCLCL